MSERSSNPVLPFIGLPLPPKIAIAAGVAAIAAVIAVAAMGLRQDQYRVLFTNLDDRDGGAIIAELAKQNIPYRFTDGGGAIEVPADMVHGARLKLASQGMPRGGTVGFELMDAARFGMTQFQERLTYQRALEGELSRTIESLQAVDTARVHLALPQDNGFLRRQQSPSASVVVHMLPGMELDRAQALAVTRLVAASVPRLTPDAVSIVDQDGNLLDQNAKADKRGEDDQLRYRRTVEDALTRKILSLIEPVVGAGNVRAQVSADIDFTESESTDEIYRPNEGDAAAAIRSEQRRLEGRDLQATAEGIPGALSNQPGDAASAPVNGPAQRTAGASNPAAGGNAPRTLESLVNYEVDKTIRVTRGANRNLRRLSAAVVINHRSRTDDQGNATNEPLKPEELESLTGLVREAIGFDSNRGDSVNVINSRFAPPAPPAEAIPFWRDPAHLPLAVDVLKSLGLLILGLLVMNKLIKPAIAMLQNPPTPALAAPTDDNGTEAPGEGRIVNQVIENEVELPAPEPDPEVVARQQLLEQQLSKRDKALTLARENPNAVAHIIRGWIDEPSS
ncbi:MAG: flagellar basal-body MS-ring/collar protein FliF [Burkholderiaceae bacterium]